MLYLLMCTIQGEKKHPDIYRMLAQLCS